MSTLSHTAEACPQNKVRLEDILDHKVTLWRSGKRVTTTPRTEIIDGARGTCMDCGRTLMPLEICLHQLACGHCIGAALNEIDAMLGDSPEESEG